MLLRRADTPAPHRRPESGPPPAVYRGPGGQVAHPAAQRPVVDRLVAHMIAQPHKERAKLPNIKRFYRANQQVPHAYFQQMLNQAVQASLQQQAQQGGGGFFDNFDPRGIDMPGAPSMPSFNPTNYMPDVNPFNNGGYSIDNATRRAQQSGSNGNNSLWSRP